MSFAYLLAILSSIGYGSGDYLGGISARRAPAPLVTAFSGLAAVAVLLAGIPFAVGHASNADFAWAVAAGVCGSAGAALIYRALALGPVSLASPVLCVVALAVPVFVGLALGERPAPLAWVGVVLAVASMPLLARTVQHEGAHTPAQIRRTLRAATLAGLAGGGFLVCVARIPSHAGLWPLVAARAVSMAILVVVVLARRLPLVPPPGARLGSLGAGAFDSAANVLFWFAVQSGSLALVSALISLAPATTVLLARALLGERWSVAQRFGLLLALGAGVCISLG
jgi:drug/metabolite transporter (DMT)-like permease